MQAAKKESQSSKKSPSNGKKGNFKGKKQFNKNQPQQKKSHVEIQEVVSRYGELTEEAKTTQWKVFSDYPLSRKTLDGLEKAGYKEPTDIQRDCITLALRGLDILGAAKTGSGKTLAFLIPVLECLWRSRWSKMDGLGALILSPTRELAYQTFQVLKKIGFNHDFSAALLIGGTDLAFERNRVAGTNIIICTPGRLLQHMDENPSFTCDSLNILVLDEADRILDMGFQQQLNAIVDNLPVKRQTMLFSATQTKSVRDLARLSLKDPVYVSVHEHATHSTPDNLLQSYTICPDEDKINMLWSFISNHKHKKTIIFMTSCKQDLLNTGCFLQHLSYEITSQSQKVACEQTSNPFSAIANRSSTSSHSSSLYSFESSCFSKFCPHCQRSVSRVVVENRSVQTSQTLVVASTRRRQWSSNIGEDCVESQASVRLSELELSTPPPIEPSIPPPLVGASIDRPSASSTSIDAHRQRFVNHLTELVKRKSESLLKMLPMAEREKRTKPTRGIDDLWTDYVRHLAMQPGALGARPAAMWREFEEVLSSAPSLSGRELKAC
uniref:ATP-dependent RNA helicase n=1 Tax=Plectus sambesii TaxID=2011161 RepID=A0A914XHN7_9BILA